MGNGVKVKASDGTVMEIENGIITTPDGMNILIKESLISISQGQICRDCGYPMTYQATKELDKPIVFKTYCSKCNPED